MSTRQYVFIDICLRILFGLLCAGLMLAVQFTNAFADSELTLQEKFDLVELGITIDEATSLFGDPEDTETTDNPDQIIYIWGERGSIFHRSNAVGLLFENGILRRATHSRGNTSNIVDNLLEDIAEPELETIEELTVDMEDFETRYDLSFILGRLQHEGAQLPVCDSLLVQSFDRVEMNMASENLIPLFGEPSQQSSRRMVWFWDDYKISIRIHDGEVVEKRLENDDLYVEVEADAWNASLDGITITVENSD